jgi:hypothetical protein
VALVQLRGAAIGLRGAGRGRLVLLLGHLGPGLRLGERRVEPGDLLGRGDGAGPQGVDLTDQFGQSLAPVGDRLDGRHQSLLGLGQAALHLLAALDGLVQARLVLGQGGAHLHLLLAQLLGLGVELVRVAAGPLLLRLGGEVAPALGGELMRRAQPLAQRGQPQERLLGLGQHRRVLGQRRLQIGQTGLDLLVRGLDLLAPLAQGGLVGDLAVERLAQRREVVGEQAQLGVAQVGLDAGRAPGHLGLPAQRLELAAQLGGEVGEPVQVDLRRLQLAQRLLLALAVLEDAGRLLDEAAAVLRLRVQDRVELALTDDHVHLPADAGVREQFLDVQQPARVAVDLVLALARAEHAPGDRDLGVLDRQGAVGVVDRERDLGPPQRRPAGRAGEDHVLHLAAAQGLGSLLAEHPGDGVDDVGLAGAVRAHDARDPRLQSQRRRRREGLETLDRQALEMHGSPGCRSGRRGGG